jgi:osmotically-inducible protein OsmY
MLTPMALSTTRFIIASKECHLKPKTQKVAIVRNSIKRGIKMARTEERIKQAVIDQLTWDDRTDESKITVERRDGTVTLRGEVPSYFSKTSAESDALSVLGVTDVN